MEIEWTSGSDAEKESAFFLPPMRTPVRISLTMELETPIFHTRIIGREGHTDFLDAIKSPNGQVISDPMLEGLDGSLWWGDDQRWFEHPIHVDAVLEPVPLLAIHYQASPVRRERRRSRRSHTQIRGVVETMDRRMARRGACWTRDISEFACRIVTPLALEAGERVRMGLALTPDRIWMAEGRVLRREDERTKLYGLEGQHAVVCWDLARMGERRAEWLRYCEIHRWDL